MWQIEYTNEFEAWWNKLDEAAQIDITAVVGLLEKRGTQLPYPYSSAIKGAKTSNLRELRVQHKGNPFRILYAFDPRRCAILLIGGNKTGKDLWYQKFIPLADKLYAEHLEELKREGELYE